MAITVKTITVDLVARTASFVEGMDKAGQISLTTSRNIKRAFDAIGTGVITALGGAATALAAMVDHAIEGAAKLEEVAQSAGVSVAALSALDYAAKQSGVSQESLAKALEKMSKSMLAAADAPKTASNAYHTLGVAVTDATGKLRPTEDVLVDLAQKFSVMQDGPMKTALAMQLFGKAGAEMVPLLNRGKAGITDLMDEAKKLGIVIDDDTAAAAKHFEESMNKLKAAADGVGNKLMKELLPSLQLVVDNIAAGATDSESRFGDLLKVAGFVGKAFLVAFGGIQTFFDDLGTGIKNWGAAVIHVFEGIGSVGKAVWDHNWNELKHAVHDANAALTEDERAGRAESTKIWKEYADGVKQFWDAGPEKSSKPKRTGESPSAPNKEKDNGAAKIQEHIDKLVAQADAEGRLAQTISGSTAETIKATAAADAQKTVDDLNAQGKKHGVELTEKQITTIQNATLRLLAYKDALDVNKQLEKAIISTEQQVEAQKELATAYGTSAEAIIAAEEKGKLAPYIREVDQLQEAYNDMAKSGQFTAAQLAQLSSSLEQAKQKLTQETAAVHADSVAKESVAAAKWDRQLGLENTQLQKQITATVGGAEALRQFNIQKHLAAFKEANPFASDADMKKLEADLQQTSALQVQLAAAAHVHAQLKYKDIQDELKALQQLREQQVGNGQDTTGVDAAIHDANLQLIQDYDTLLGKTNSFGNGAKIALDQIVHQSETTAQQFSKVLTTGLDQVNQEFGKLVTTGKFSFSSIEASFENMLVQMALKALEAQLAKSLFGDPSQQGGGGGLLSSLGSSIGSLFGGGKAIGGNIDAGKSYRVHQDEWIVPKTAGTVIPADNVGNGGGQTIHQEIHLHGVQDFDSFNRSESQLRASMYRMSASAHARTK
jgi:hypothetical protein